MTATSKMVSQFWYLRFIYDFCVAYLATEVGKYDELSPSSSAALALPAGNSLGLGCETIFNA